MVFKRIWQILFESDRGVYTYRGYGRVPFTLGVEPQPEAHFPCLVPTRLNCGLVLTGALGEVLLSKP